MKKSENLEKIFDFLKKIENLKSTYRYNTTIAGEKESTADHSWRMGLMTFMIAEELKLDVDILHSVKIALVHDLAEALTGDIDALLVAEGKVSADEKGKQEIEAMKELKATLPEELGKEIFEFWMEYEGAQTQESKFVKALDKIETLTQLAESGHMIYDKPEFIGTYGNKELKMFPELREVMRVVKMRLKKEFLKGKFEWKREYDI